MRSLTHSVAAAAMLLALPIASSAQEAVTTTAPVSVVPHLIKFSGALPGASNKAETVDVKFALYAAQTGGEALWTETQQVSLDASGKYSVLLGSSTTLPDSAFAQGQARWIGVTLGGEQESARTILVATPYSLKASDAETLGGHPLSDFTLKNALPAGGTNITQINVGNGVTGGGTGPTVTLGLSSTYLENLGNEIYPQLNGTNKFGGKNTFTAGDLLLGTSPVLSAANVTAASPVTATISGNTVKIGLSNSALLTLGDEVYPQLSGANKFSGTNVFKGTTGFSAAVNSTNQFFVSANLPGYYAVIGANAASSGLGGGVFGSTNNTEDGANGVKGVTSAGGLSAGVYGDSVSPSAEGDSLLNGNGLSPGVWGDAGNPTGDSVPIGVFASADDGIGAIVANNSSSGKSTFVVFNGDSTGVATPFAVLNGDGTQCQIDGSANFTCSGSFTSIRPVEGRKLATFGVQSAENWIEDAGGGQLSSGHAHVTLDPAFVGTVNTGVEYRVFLTPEGDCKGLYISGKGPDGFDVSELGGGQSSIAFDYRIMAKPRGAESARLTDVTAQVEKSRTQLKTAKSSQSIRPASEALQVPVPVAAVRPAETK